MTRSLRVSPRALAAAATLVLLMTDAALRPEAAQLQAALQESVIEVVATGIVRPLEIALDGRSLVVLSPGGRGDAAAEIHRFGLDVDTPIDLSRHPSVRIPFSDARLASLGSLAIHPRTRELFLGEENGRRVYRLSGDERLTLVVTGLARLAGGTTIAFDAENRLVIVDHVDPRISVGEDRPPPGLESLKEEDYRGPLVFRLPLDLDAAIPRRVGSLAPFFPRAWGGRAGGALLPKLIAVVALRHDLFVLASSGELFRLSTDGALVPFARLPVGQYNRINMTADREGTIFVSGGFHTGRVFRVSPSGIVSVLASGLGDPEGIAVDDRGAVYVAESARHRIIRLRVP